MPISDHAVNDPASPFLSVLTIGKATIEFRKGSELFTFTDIGGQLRSLDDPTGNVGRILEIILEGSGAPLDTIVGEQPAAPPSNLVNRYEGQVQHLNLIKKD